MRTSKLLFLLKEITLADVEMLFWNKDFFFLFYNIILI